MRRGPEEWSRKTGHSAADSALGPALIVLTCTGPAPRAPNLLMKLEGSYGHADNQFNKITEIKQQRRPGWDDLRAALETRALLCVK